MHKRLKIGGGEADGSHFVARAMTGYADDTGKGGNLRQRIVPFFRKRGNARLLTKQWSWRLIISGHDPCERLETKANSRIERQ